MQDPAIEVAETCQIALHRLNWVANSGEESQAKSLYLSIDPAPPSNEKDVEILKVVLMDDKESLFERYRAMFSLRNLGTTESINALGEGWYYAYLFHQVFLSYCTLSKLYSCPQISH